MEEKARLGLNEVKTEAEKIEADGNQTVKDTKDKVTK